MRFFMKWALSSMLVVSSSASFADDLPVLFLAGAPGGKAIEVACKVWSIPGEESDYTRLNIGASDLGKSASFAADPKGRYRVGLEYVGKGMERSVVLTVLTADNSQGSHSEEVFYGWLRLSAGVPQFVKIQGRVSVGCVVPMPGDPEEIPTGAFSEAHEFRHYVP
jgi:hypothetical protein